MTQFSRSNEQENKSKNGGVPMKFKKKTPVGVGWFDLVVTLAPVSWVFACSFGAFEFFLSGHYLRFIGELAVSFVVVIILVGLGMFLTGTCISFDQSENNQSEKTGRVKVFLVELAVLFVSTYLIYSR